VFDIQIQEWQYLDVVHNVESISYLVAFRTFMRQSSVEPAPTRVIPMKMASAMEMS
jgi:hypothetical protein